MKKFIIIGIIIGVLLVISIVIINVNSIEKIYVQKDNSYFYDFSVENNKVYIKCSITLKNTYKTDKTVRLFANMNDDVNSGLLKQAQIYALNEDGTKSIFTIKGNSKQTYDVIFVGDYAGTNKKHDRLLPDIKIEIIS